MNRNAAFGVGALLGAAAAVVWDRRNRIRTAPASPAPESRQRELREKLAGAQQPEVASPASEPAAPEFPAPSPDPPSSPPPSPPQPEARPAAPPPPPEPPPADEFEAMRRRIHQEGKAAADEMRRAPDEAS